VVGQEAPVWRSLPLTHPRGSGRRRGRGSEGVTPRRACAMHAAEKRARGLARARSRSWVARVTFECVEPRAQEAAESAQRVGGGMARRRLVQL